METLEKELGELPNKQERFERITGKEIQEQPEDEPYTEGKWFGYEGEYRTNNGALAFIDENAVKWVGRETPELVGELKEAGYKLGRVWVPYSNDGGAWMNKRFPETRTEE